MFEVTSLVPISECLLLSAEPTPGGWSGRAWDSQGESEEILVPGHGSPKATHPVLWQVCRPRQQNSKADNQSLHNLPANHIPSLSNVGRWEGETVLVRRAFFSRVWEAGAVVRKSDQGASVRGWQGLNMSLCHLLGPVTELHSLCYLAGGPSGTVWTACGRAEQGTGQESLWAVQPAPAADVSG